MRQKKKHVERECDHCGIPFVPNYGQEKYCSPQHRGSANQEKIRARKRQAEYVELDVPIDRATRILSMNWNYSIVPQLEGVNLEKYRKKASQQMKITHKEAK